MVLELGGEWRSLAGGAGEVELAAATVAQALAELDRRFPGASKRLLDARGQPRRYVLLLLNGEELDGPGALERALLPEDRLHLLAPVAGG